MRIRVFALPALLGLSALSLSSCGGASGGSGSQNTATPANTTHLYAAGVVNGNAAVLSYPISSTGSSVVPTVAATMGTADTVRAMRTDGAGNLYVLTFQNSNYGLMNIYVYSMLSGALTLTRSFSYTGGAGESMTVDKNGVVYIAIQNGPVESFAATASGTVAPTTTFNITGQNFVSMATDSSGNIYALSNNAGAVLEYAPGFASLTPARTLVVEQSYGSYLWDVAAGPDGSVYAGIDPPTGPPEVLKFAVGATTSTITPISTQTFVNPNALAIDANSQIWIATLSQGVPVTYGTINQTTTFATTVDVTADSAQSIVVY